MAIDTSTRSNQVKDHLLNYINKNQLVQGDQLPAEAEMAKQFGVSRNTIREAYIALEAEGIIVRRHGIGTFIVRSPIVANSLQSAFKGYPQNIRAAGYTPGFRNLSNTHAVAPPEAYDALDAPVSEQLLCVKRVLLADENPAVYISDYFAPGIKKTDFDWDAFNGDMVEFMTASLGINDYQHYSKIQAVSADDEIASYLQLPNETPIVLTKSAVYTLDNHQPLVYTLSYLNPNIIELDVSGLLRSK